MKQKRNKLLMLLALAACLLALCAGGTLAFLATQTPEKTNTFDVAKTSVTVEETFNTVKKTDVKIKNESDMPVFVRAMVLVTWKNSSGAVYPQLPVAGTDYKVDWGSWTDSPADAENKWFQVGETYYYASPLKPGASTKNLIDECTSVDSKTPAGYQMHVQIIASAIQASPADAVHEAWPDVAVSNGNLVKKAESGS